MIGKKIGKKGMGVGQVFIFIIAALTFALVMIFGYKIINSFLEKGEQVQFLQFKNDLETSVKKIYTEYGALRKETFSLPTKYEQVCFVDMDAPYKPAFCAQDSIACASWEQAGGYNTVDENVFLKPTSPKIKVFKIGVVARTPEEEGFLCIPVVSGQFTIMLEGKGDRTQISAAPSATEE